MKRYFDVIGGKVTLQLDLAVDGRELTAEKLGKTLNVNLREIDKKEYKKLTKEYVKR